MKITLYWPDEDRRLLADLKWLAKARGESLSLMVRKLVEQELKGGKGDGSDAKPSVKRQPPARYELEED